MAQSKLFMVIESFGTGAVGDVYRRFRDKGRKLPDGLRNISSWVDVEFRRCFQLMEVADESALHAWTTHWSDLVDFEIVPVHCGRGTPVLAAALESSTTRRAPAPARRRASGKADNAA
jgi:hypothetical protein